MGESKPSSGQRIEDAAFQRAEEVVDSERNFRQEPCDLGCVKAEDKGPVDLDAKVSENAKSADALVSDNAECADARLSENEDCTAVDALADSSIHLEVADDSDHAQETKLQQSVADA